MPKLRYWLVAIMAALAIILAVAPRIAAAPVNPPPQGNIDAPGVSFTPDPRIQALDGFFTAHKCPYANSQAYLTAADKYGLDYRLLPALSVVEQECGRKNPHNNLFGYGSKTVCPKDKKCYSTVMPFASIETGIDFVANALATKSYYKGKTLKQVLHAYNSANPNYYGRVTGLMAQISVNP